MFSKSQVQVQLVKLFKQNGFIGQQNYLESIPHFLNCTTQKQIVQVIDEFKIDIDFKEDLKEILDTTQSEILKQTTQRLEKQRIQQYQTLIKISQQTDKIKESFSLKHLFRLQMHLFSKKYPQIKIKIKDIFINIQEQVLALKQTIKSQGFWNYHIENAFNKFASYEQLSGLESILNAVRREIQILSFPKLKNLVLNNQMVGNKILSQNGIIFLGLTGAGKSTTILWILGNKIIPVYQKQIINNQTSQTSQTSNKTQLINYISDPSSLTEQQKQIVIKPGSKSITKKVVAVTLPQCMINKYTPNKTYILDTPGFEDTAGSLMQLCNSIGIVSSVSKLKQARFVVLINGNDHGSRHGGIKKIIQILDGIFTSYKKISKSITFLFNFYKKEQIQNMNAVITTIQTQYKKNQISSNINDILQDLKLKTTKDKIISINPSVQNIQTSKRILNKIIESPSTDKVRYLSMPNPRKRVSLDIQNQSNIIYKLSMHYLKQQKLQIVQYFVKQLLNFKQIMNQHLSEEIEIDSLKKIEQKLSQNLLQKVKCIKVKISKVFQVLNKTQIQTIRKQVDSLKLYNNLIKMFSISSPHEKITKQIDQKLKYFVQNFKQNMDTLKQDSIKAYLIFTKDFAEKQCSLILIQIIKQKLKVQYDKYDSLLKQQKYQLAIKHYLSFKKFESFYQLFISSQKTQNLSQVCCQLEIDQIIINHINTKYKHIQTFLQNFGKCSSQELQSIKFTTIIFNGLKNNKYYLQTIHNSNNIKILLDKIQQRILSFISLQIQNAQNYLNTKRSLNSQTVKFIKNIYSKKLTIQQIPCCKSKGFQLFKKMNIKIQTCIDIQKKVIQDILNALFNESKRGQNYLKRQVNKLDCSLFYIQSIIDLEIDDNFSLQQVYLNLQQILVDQIDMLQTGQTKLNWNDFFIDDDLGCLSKIIQASNAFSSSTNYQSQMLKNQKISSYLLQLSKLSEKIFVKFIQLSQNIIELVDQKLNEQEQDNIFSNSTLNSKYQKSIYKGSNNLKLKNINQMIKFIEKGRKTFISISKKQQQIVLNYKQMSLKLKLWQQKQFNTIKKYLQLIRESQNQHVVIKSKEIKRKLQQFISIKTNYKYLQKVTELYQDIKQQVSNVLQQMFIHINKQIQIQSQSVNSFHSLIKLKTKCRDLNILDNYTQTRNSFQKLQNKITDQINKTGILILKRVQYSLKTKKWNEVINNMLITKDYFYEIYEQIQRNFIQQLIKQIEFIKSKAHCGQSNYSQRIKSLIETKARLLQYNNSEQMLITIKSMDFIIER